MSEIIKTEAVVLSKLNYGDSSSIAALYTKEYGKLSVIIKGARSSKSKIGTLVDPLNHIGIVIYKKDTRDLQILSSADIINHFPKLKEDLESLKFAYAVLELVKNLTVEHEHNLRLFRGIVRILNLLNASKENPKILFLRFFMFFLTELGYEVQLDNCFSCGKSNLKGSKLSYNFENGIFCEDCKQNIIESYSFSAELFDLLICLKHFESIGNAGNALLDKAINFLEKYLKYHVPDFKGISSIQLFQ